MIATLINSIQHDPLFIMGMITAVILGLGGMGAQAYLHFSERKLEKPHKR